MLVPAKDEESSYIFLIQASFEREQLTESGYLFQEILENSLGVLPNVLFWLWVR